MLTDVQQYIISIIRKSFNIDSSVTSTTSISFDLQDQQKQKYIATIILKSGILLTIYDELPDSLQRILHDKQRLALKQSIMQNLEGEKILSTLSNSKLNCIPLKGWELRKFYPYQEMRQMADLDILVKPYDFTTIKSVMDKIGYHCENGESNWKHDNFINDSAHEITVEMHKRLTDDSYKVQQRENEMWKRASADKGSCIFHMDDEDFYIFHFIHLHKDFMNGSLGIRRIIDTWILDRNKEKLNVDIVRRTLEDFGILTFHDRMIALGKVLMGESKLDTNSEILLKHAFTHGIYGSNVSYKAGRIAAMGKNVKSGKVRSAVAAVFLPYSRMKAQYPILVKHPIMLSFCWIKRIVRFLRGDVKQYISRLNYDEINEKEYAEMKLFFEAGGIKV